MTRRVLFALALVSCGSAAPSTQSRSPGEAPFGVAVQFETGFWYGAHGDEVHVDEIRGDQPTLAVGGTYHFRGRYVLRSRADAVLMATIMNGASQTPDLANRVVVKQGSGAFDLPLVITALGYPEVGFYSAEGGRERVITRDDAFSETFVGLGKTLYTQTPTVQRCDVARAAAAAAGRVSGKSPADVPVTFETREARFTKGDALHIDEVRGLTDDLSECGTYHVKGHYTLRTHPHARIAIHVMNGEASGDLRHVDVDAGEGTFDLEFGIERAGWPHVSMYPVDGGDAFGITYFGRGATVFRGDVERVTDRVGR